MTKNDKPNQIELTKEGLDELTQELSELKEQKLVAVIKRVAKAREYGDLSENAEYHSAKEEQEFIETRIEEIEGIIARSVVVKNTRSKSTIGVGSTVVVSKKGSKDKKTLYVVGEFEANPTEGKISVGSPLGEALVGKKKGDKAVFNAPAGEIEYRIVEIK
ncbi:MAG: transcription elongation factor GreA [Pseudomonadales bacterium]|nr:transcription elongation factor GreA [Pseudomonadales bacterium]